MIYRLNSALRSREIERFAHFVTVGLTGTLVDFGVLILLKELLGVPLLIANVLSYTAGIVNNFVLNRLWTFPEARGKRLWTQFGQFAAVSAIGLLINTGIVLLLTAPLSALFSQAQMGYLAAKLVATVVVLVWNFFLNRYWTFSDVKK
ncbi:MAG: GtrA family protein [Anaerolineae bacterium]|nr:GtrA family protein [Anaerolineae bacterium]